MFGTNIMKTLLKAILSKDTHTVEKLLTKALSRSTFNINDSDESKGLTPLVAAARLSTYEISKLLVENGADINKAGNDGTLPLESAFLNDNLDTAKFLLEKGADIHKTRKEFCLLSTAIMRNRIDILKLLTRIGLDPNGSDTNSLTPLMLSARDGNIEAFQVLLEAGADILIIRSDYDGNQLNLLDILDLNISGTNDNALKDRYFQIKKLIINH